MRAVGVEELRDLPFVRHQVDPELLVGAWQGADGAALVLAGRHLDGGSRLVATALGAPEPLAPLLAYAAASQPLPARLLIVAGSEAAVPAAWSWSPGRRWYWMLTKAQPQPSDPRVVEVDDPDEVAALLDRGRRTPTPAPARPGSRRGSAFASTAARWLRLAPCSGSRTGTGHLRGVTVAAARPRPGARAARQHGDDRAGAGRRPGVASLGVYVDNEPALRIYRGLGYEVAHSSSAGPVSGSCITTAVVPSR